MKALAIDPGFPGAGRVLRELAKVSPNKVVEYRSSPIKLSQVENNQIVFLPAWNPGYEQVFMKKPWKPVIVWTSPPLQSEMVPQELEYIRKIRYYLENERIYKVWFGDPNWLYLFPGWEQKAFYAPYPVTLPGKWREKPLPEWPNGAKQVSLFGPLHARKNVLNQATAVALAQCFLHFTDSSAKSVLDLAGVTYQNHGWLNDQDYEKLLLEGIDLGLQCSIPGVESFSYVAWDHISRGIPCLNSTDWFPFSTSRGHSVRELAYQILTIQYRVDQMGGHQFIRKWAETFAKERNEKCLAILSKELGI